MTLRSGNKPPRIEVARVDELPLGVPSTADRLTGPTHDERGKFAEGNAIAKLGGSAKKGKTRLASQLGLTQLIDTSAFRPYKASAASFRRAQCSELARNVGGGVCGPGPSSLIASAALQLAWSRYLSDRAATENDAALAWQASKLANDSRQNLLAAHELCALEAKGRSARGIGGGMPWLTQSTDNNNNGEG